MKRERAIALKIIETRQARRAASNAQARASIEAHKARMREAETAGLLRTLARMVRRAKTKPNA
jgi:hypothetical protein